MITILMRISIIKYTLLVILIFVSFLVSGQLSWSGDTPVYPTGSVAHTYTNVSGLSPNRTATIGMTYNEPSPTASWGTSTPSVPAGSPSRLSISPNFSANTSTRNLIVSINFSHPACDANFILDDIDLGGASPFDFVDQVTITANEFGGGATTPTSISAGTTNSVAGNVITGTSSGSSQNTVSFLGKCITSVQLVFTNGPNVKTNPNTQNFAILDINSNESVGDPFPVEFISFDGSQLDKAIELVWATANELNNEGFEVQRSNNAISFESIGVVEGKNEDALYRFTDQGPKVGKNYYRLKQKDFDGSFKYSKIIDVFYNVDGTFSIYPNPALANQPISFKGVNSESQLLISNQKGQVFQQGVLEKDLKLPTGTYFLKVLNTPQQESKKLVVY